MTPKIEHHPGTGRFETEVDGRRASVEYRLEGPVMTILHTRVPPEIEGRGIAAALVQAALDHAEAHQLKVDPVCSYARDYMDRLPGRTVDR